MRIPEVEQWIESCQCIGKPAIIKVLLPEPDDPEFFYFKRTEGTRYGQFCTYAANRRYYVVHKSGASCGLPFSSENGARRLVFLLRKLADWRKVRWEKNRLIMIPQLRLAMQEAAAYCHDKDRDFPNLLKFIRLNMTEDEKEVFEDPPEVETVEFGGQISKPTKTVVRQKVVVEDDGWGTTIT
jgi:hypothetical protein